MVSAGGKDERKDPAYGADVLRMWVASVDYSSDVMVRRGLRFFFFYCTAGSGNLNLVFSVYSRIKSGFDFHQEAMHRLSHQALW